MNTGSGTVILKVIIMKTNKDAADALSLFVLCNQTDKSVR